MHQTGTGRSGELFADVKAEVDWKRIEVRKGLPITSRKVWKVKKIWSLCETDSILGRYEKTASSRHRHLRWYYRKKNLPPVLIFRQRMSE